MQINATLLGQMLTFAIFVAFTLYFIWPPLQQKMHQRAKFISDSLAAAELRTQQLANADVEIKEIMRQAHEKYNLLVEQAYKEAHSILDNARSKAFQDSHVIVENTHNQITLLLVQAKSDLQKELADLIMLGVQQIVNKSLSLADHREIIDDLIKRLA